MATQQITGIDAEGNQVAFTVTDDPAENASLKSILTQLQGALDVSGATVTVTDDGALTLAANDGTDIGDVGIEDVSAVTGQATKSGSLPVTLASDEDTVNVQEDTALDVSASTVPVEQQTPVQVEDSSGTPIDPATEQKLENVRSLLDKLDDALASVASDVLRTEQQSPISVEDTTDTQIDPARATDFPEQEFNGADLTFSDQVIGPVSVGRSQSLIVRGHETTGGTMNVSVEWQDSNGNTLGTQSATEINLNDVTTDHARLFRKGAQAVVTFSNGSGATSTNGFVDTHR